MWIPKTITGSEKDGTPFIAKVLYSDGKKISVSSLERVENIESAMPYGIACVPPKGSKAVILPVSSSAIVCGVVGDNPFALEEGEVGLYSSGGASIVLKKNGTVVINGKVFEAEGK